MEGPTVREKPLWCFAKGFLAGAPFFTNRFCSKPVCADVGCLATDPVPDQSETALFKSFRHRCFPEGFLAGSRFHKPVLFKTDVCRCEFLLVTDPVPDQSETNRFKSFQLPPGSKTPTLFLGGAGNCPWLLLLICLPLLLCS